MKPDEKAFEEHIADSLVERGGYRTVKLGNASGDFDAERGLDLAPITSLDEPSFAQFDLRFWKVMPFSDGRGHGEVFVQIFNVFDRFNVGLIEGRVISPYFGRPIAMAGPSRTFQLGVKLAF